MVYIRRYIIFMGRTLAFIGFSNIIGFRNHAFAHIRSAVVIIIIKITNLLFLIIDAVMIVIIIILKFILIMINQG